MSEITRLPALPVFTNDPYFSIWCPADRLTDVDTAHWSGPRKPVRGAAVIDGVTYRFLGRGEGEAMELLSQRVTATATVARYRAGGVRLTLTLRTPMLPEEPDVFSIPASFMDWTLESEDGAAHEVKLRVSASARLCYDGDEAPQMEYDTFALGAMRAGMLGQLRQKPLSHSGDHVTIDWGYLYLAGEGTAEASPLGLVFEKTLRVAKEAVRAHLIVAYDDVLSILYFGHACKAWYARGGKTIVQAIAELEADYDALTARCEALDARVAADALAAGSEDYVLIAAAAWRHTFAAHKLIATPAGEMAFLSKENDSNGCIGTVDVSYPSIPLFIKYAPELVNAMCRPVLEYASMPVWVHDFAPHDVGRYPIVNGQVYALRDNTARRQRMAAYVYPPYYLYPAQEGERLFDSEKQMPVEESGNMLVMLYAAATQTRDTALLQKYRPLLDKWVRYLVEYGEDPGNQLCTDDFAGHLAHNVNLSAKAVVGVACYARILEMLGEPAEKWRQRARDMAQSWRTRAQGENGTCLTFDGMGWSMKYNLAWDLALNLQLLPEDFYRAETESYLPRLNRYGLPLDSRADYTKSDWECYAAAMARDMETRRALLRPLRTYLEETSSRVAFSDWYDTKTGRFEQFIARSVQGGVFMPMLIDAE